jgi:hypothetical protein
MIPPTDPPDKSATENIVSLPGASERRPTPPARRFGRVHGLATAGMALSAMVGILAMLAFITVGWPGRTGRYVIAVVVCAALIFLTCASIAVLAAARDSYARPPDREH